MHNEYSFLHLLGKTITKFCLKHEEGLEGGLPNHLLLYTTPVYETYSGVFLLSHNQECCETVYVEDITGDIEDIIGSPIILAGEEGNINYAKVEEHYWDNSDKLWTFYKLGTEKGSITIRWYGCSNGYYACDVDMKELDVDSLDHKEALDYMKDKTIYIPAKFK